MENLDQKSPEPTSAKSSDSSKSPSPTFERETISKETSRVASRMAKETIEEEVSKELVEKAMEDGLVSASGND